MTRAQLTLSSVLMYLYSSHVGKGRNNLLQISGFDPGDADAIRIVEHFYIISQILGW